MLRIELQIGVTRKDNETVCKIPDGFRRAVSGAKNRGA